MSIPVSRNDITGTAKRGEQKPHSGAVQNARASYIKELRRNVREWTKTRDEWIALAGGCETAKSRECDERVREAKSELRRLHA